MSYEHYWWMDIPGLTEEEAVRAQDLLLPSILCGVVLINPASFMGTRFDRSGVELAVKCYEAGLAFGDLSHSDRMGAMSMVEEYQEWLEHDDVQHP